MCGQYKVNSTQRHILSVSIDLGCGVPEVFLFFLKFFVGHMSIFWDQWYPCFGLLVTSPLDFKARVGSLIRTWQRHAWYMFPEICFWCNTSTSVYGQHSSQSLSPHACFSRGRMLDLNHRPPAWQADVLTTRPQRPSEVPEVKDPRVRFHSEESGLIKHLHSRVLAFA